MKEADLPLKAFTFNALKELGLYFHRTLKYVFANDFTDSQKIAISLVRQIRKTLQSSDFIKRHKSKEKAFTRKRFFCFQTTCVMILQKTLKSIQLHIHSLSHALEKLSIKTRAVTAGAWTRSRAKLKHSAFIEINEDILLLAVLLPGARR